MKNRANKLTLIATIPSVLLVAVLVFVFSGIRVPQGLISDLGLVFRVSFMLISFVFSLVGIVSYNWTNKSWVMKTCQALNIPVFIFSAFSFAVGIFGLLPQPG